MDSDILKQEPLFNLSRLDFFGLQMKSDNSDWDKYLEEMLLLRFYNFRISYIGRNIEFLQYFLILLESNFLVIKSDKTLEAIFTMKQKIKRRTWDLSREYIYIVNLSRIIFVYIIQLLYDKGVRLTDSKVQKFLMVDSELDSKEKPEIAKKLLKYDFIRNRIDTKSRIGKLFLLYFFLDIAKLINSEGGDLNESCIIY